MVDPALVRDRFRERYGGAPRLFAAPGRVNLIGEHTDYNDGFVLPMAIEKGVMVAAAARPGRRVRVRSLDLGDEIELDLDRPGPPRRGAWIDRVEGVAQSLARRGVTLGGADLVLAGDVPLGAGLSSSAALEVAVGFTLWSLTAAGGEVDPVALALAAQAAENDWVGTRCGVMDPMIAALGAADRALLIDCRSLEASPVPLALPEHVIVVCDTRVTHDLASSAYNDRRAECERGVELLQRWLPDVRALRDVAPTEFEAVAGELPEPVRRRCRHVIGENARTEGAAAALRAGELGRFGRLMAESHRSLRDDYEVSCPELDLLAEVAAATPGVLGGRMTGGGFGGCVIALCERAAEARFAAAASDAFEARFGRRPVLFSSRAAAGAREVEA